MVTNRVKGRARRAGTVFCFFITTGGAAWKKPLAKRLYFVGGQAPPPVLGALRASPYFCSSENCHRTSSDNSSSHSDDAGVCFHSIIVAAQRIPMTQYPLPCWTLSVPFWSCYLLWCVFYTLVLRVIFCGFRAAAMARNEFYAQDPRPWKWWAALLQCNYGFGHKEHADFWLNGLVGLGELLAYPVLLETGYFGVIGAWLGIKTAGSFSGWKHSRTSFNRFLLNIILELAIAYFCLARFVHGCGTPGPGPIFP